MLKDVFSNRLFIGALAFFIFCVGGSLLYQQHVERQVEKQLAESILKPKIPPKPKVRTPVLDTSQGGHFHADGTWHADPHAPSDEVVPVDPVTRTTNDPQNPGVNPEEVYQQKHANKGAGNPHPFENVPVDLWDFEATKAAMIENINFIKANWDPKVYNREVSIADSLTANISNATDMPIFTREQRKELKALRMELLAFQGIEIGRIKALQEQGYRADEAAKIATDETLQRWGLK